MTPGYIALPTDIAARKDLTASDKLIYALIADRIGDNGKAWPGTRRLAREAGINRETVLVSVGRLKQHGLLRVEKRANGHSNIYRLKRKTGRKTQPAGKPNRPEKPTTGGRKTQPVAAGFSDRNSSLLNLKKGRAAAPPAKERSKKPKGKQPDSAEGFEPMARWAEGWRARRGGDVPKRGAVAGILKRLAKDHSAARVADAVMRWFAVSRMDYGIELFAARLDGGNVELCGPPITPADEDPLALINAKELAAQAAEEQRK